MSSPQQTPVARTAAYLAAPVWAVQALIRTAGPKVQMPTEFLIIALLLCLPSREP